MVETPASVALRALKQIQRSSGEKRGCQRVYSGWEVTTRIWFSACGAARIGNMLIRNRPGLWRSELPRTHSPSADQSYANSSNLLGEVTNCSSPPPAGVRTIENPPLTCA